MTTTAKNLDGTPFFANLHAPIEGLTITINEAYLLVGSLSDQQAVVLGIASNDDLPEATREAGRTMYNDYRDRISTLNRAIDTAKRGQYNKYRSDTFHERHDHVRGVR